MARRLDRVAPRLGTQTVEITEAAIATYRRLRAVAGNRLVTHPARDGGLICEYRASRARPRLWRISPDGAVLPDSRYSFALRAFTTANLPHGL